jgi:hypothetical protein
MSKIEIVLPKTDYCGGDTIRGAVVVEVPRRIRSRGVRIGLEGYESEGFATGVGDSGIPKKSFLFQDLLELSNDRIIPPGKHRFPFEYRLPEGLPGDYESHRGEAAIRYELFAYVDRPMWVDMRTVRGITMYEPVDASASAARAEGQKTCQFESEGSLNITAAIDKNVVAPGEQLHASLILDNKCKHDVRAVRLGVEATETVLVDGEHHQHKDIVHEADFETEVESGVQRTLELDYTVGTEIYASIRASSLVRVEHHLVVTIDVPRATDPHVHIPILVREIPGKPAKGHGV